MKKLLYKSGCSLLIAACGALVPLTAAQALDLQERIHQERLGGGWGEMRSESMPVHDYGSQTYGSQTTPQGAEGPMRSDWSSSRPAEYDAQAYNRDIQKRLGPIGGVNTP